MESNLIKLATILRGFALNQIIASAVRLDIPQLLIDRHRSGDELAKLTGVPWERLRMILAVLCELDLAADQGDEVYAKSELTELLDRETGILYGQALLAGEMYYRAWANLDYSLKSGESAFPDVFGMSMWEYLEANPAIGNHFARTMGAASQKSSAYILDTLDFPSDGVVVDIGAGDGALISAALLRYPKMRGIALELPGQVQNIVSTIRKNDLVDRCDVIGGNFFENVPKGGDLYVFKGVFHNWRSDQLEPMLGLLHKEMGSGKRIAVIERSISASNKISLNEAVNTLTMTLLFGASDRTSEQYASLLREAGFIVEIRANLETRMDIMLGVKQ